MSITRLAMPLIMACAVIAASISASAAPLVLADKGTAKAAILIPAKPTEVERFAAGELAAYLEKMSGGKFQVLNEGSALKPGQAVISIGRTRLARKVQVQLPAGQRNQREAFRIVRRGKTLVITGNPKGDGCDLGTMWGVCRLLEKLGIGRYLPDPLFEVVPDEPTIAIENIDLTDAPFLPCAGAAVRRPRWSSNPGEDIHSVGIRCGFRTCSTWC